MLAYFVGSQELQNRAYFHIIEQHPSVFFFGESVTSPFVLSFIVTGFECWGCWCSPAVSRLTSKVDDAFAVLPDVGLTPFLWPPFIVSKGSEASSVLLSLATFPLECLGVDLGVTLLLDCEFFLFCSSNLPSLHSRRSSSASWLISPSGRNGLSHPS